MKRSQVLCAVILCVSLVMLIGCGFVGKNASQQPQVSPGEDIDPFDYGDEFTGYRSAGRTTLQSPRTGGVQEEQKPSSMPDTGTSETSNGRAEPGTQVESLTSEVYGYRIQIGIDESKDDMEELAEYARSRIDLSVYLEFEAPFYRVRVGDFKIRAEAEKYVKILKNKGFKDSLWVFSKIFIQ